MFRSSFHLMHVLGSTSEIVTVKHWFEEKDKLRIPPFVIRRAKLLNNMINDNSCDNR